MVEHPDIHEAIARLQELPTLPAVLGHILNTAADPNASALDLAEVLSRDQSLGATLLKLVNSAYYGFYKQITSLSQAVVILGFIEVRKVAMAATAFRSLEKSASRTQLWRHSLATALIAEECAKRFSIPLEGGFEAGLLHDIGKVAFDLLFPEAYQDAADLAKEKEWRIGQAETEIFQMDHSKVGGILAQHWNLPDTVSEAIRQHHLAQERDKEAPSLPDLTAIADYISYSIDLGDANNGLVPDFPDRAAQRLGISNSQALELGIRFQEEEEGLNEFLAILEAS